MIVEFIGSTGAGKTTVLRSVERRMANRATTITSADLVTGLLGLQGTAHPTLQNLIQELLGFPFFVSLLYRHRKFVMCTTRLLLREAHSAMISINNLRSLERKLGVYSLVKRLDGDRIILVDEGPMLAAHMFVYAADPMKASEIAKFAEVLPLPDAIVYVRAPIETVVDRTLIRTDPPRELRSCSRADLVRYAEAAAALFDQLVARLSGVLPILVVDNPNMDECRKQVVAEAIALFIQKHTLEARRRPNAALIGSTAWGARRQHTDAR
jgi:thymidylate kinase